MQSVAVTTSALKTDASRRSSSAASGGSLGAKRVASSNSLKSLVLQTTGTSRVNPLDTLSASSPALRQEHMASFYHSPSTAKRLLGEWASPTHSSRTEERGTNGGTKEGAGHHVADDAGKCSIPQPPSAEEAEKDNPPLNSEGPMVVHVDHRKVGFSNSQATIDFLRASRAARCERIRELIAIRNGEASLKSKKQKSNNRLGRAPSGGLKSGSQTEGASESDANTSSLSSAAKSQQQQQRQLGALQLARLETFYEDYCKGVAEKGPADWSVVGELVAKVDPLLLDKNQQMARLRQSGFNPLRCPVMPFSVLVQYAMRSPAMADKPLPKAEQETVNAFVCLGGNPDRTGHITTCTLRNILENFKLLLDVQSLLHEIDTDGSGTIEYDEFEAFYLKKRRMAEAAMQRKAEKRRRKEQLAKHGELCQLEEEENDEDEDEGEEGDEHMVARTLSMTSVEAFDMLTKMLHTGRVGFGDEDDDDWKKAPQPTAGEKRYSLDEADGNVAEGEGNTGTSNTNNNKSVAFVINPTSPHSQRRRRSSNEAPSSSGANSQGPALEHGGNSLLFQSLSPLSGVFGAAAAGTFHFNGGTHQSVTSPSGAQAYDGSATPMASAFKQSNNANSIMMMKMANNNNNNNQLFGALLNISSDTFAPASNPSATLVAGTNTNNNNNLLESSPNNSFALSFAGGVSFASSSGYANYALSEGGGGGSVILGSSSVSAAASPLGTSLRAAPAGGGSIGRRARATVVRREKTAAAILTDKLKDALDKHSAKLKEVDRKHYKASSSAEHFSYFTEVDHVTELAVVTVERQKRRASSAAKIKQAFDERVERKRGTDFGVEAWHSSAKSSQSAAIVYGTQRWRQADDGRCGESTTYSPPRTSATPTHGGVRSSEDEQPIPTKKNESSSPARPMSANPSRRLEDQRRPSFSSISDAKRRESSAGDSKEVMPSYARPLSASIPFGPPSTSGTGTASLIVLMRARIASEEAKANDRDLHKKISSAEKKICALSDMLRDNGETAPESSSNHKQKRGTCSTNLSSTGNNRDKNKDYENEIAEDDDSDVSDDGDATVAKNAKMKTINVDTGGTNPKGDAHNNNNNNNNNSNVDGAAVQDEKTDCEYPPRISSAKRRGPRGAVSLKDLVTSSASVVGGGKPVCCPDTANRGNGAGNKPRPTTAPTTRRRASFASASAVDNGADRIHGLHHQPTYEHNGNSEKRYPHPPRERPFSASTRGNSSHTNPNTKNNNTGAWRRQSTASSYDVVGDRVDFVRVGPLAGRDFYGAFAAAAPLSARRAAAVAVAHSSTTMSSAAAPCSSRPPSAPRRRM